MLNKLTLEVQHTYINTTIDDDTKESESLEILLNNCSEVAKHSYIEKVIDNYNLKILSTLINNCPNNIEIKSWHIDKAFENPKLQDMLQIVQATKYMEMVFGPLDIIDEHDFDIALGGTILDHMKLYDYTNLIGNVDDNLDS